MKGKGMAVFIDLESLKAAEKDGFAFVRACREDGHLVFARKVGGESIDEGDVAFYNRCVEMGVPLSGIFVDPNALHRHYPALKCETSDVVRIAPNTLAVS